MLNLRTQEIHNLYDYGDPKFNSKEYIQYAEWACKIQSLQNSKHMIFKILQNRVLQIQKLRSKIQNLRDLEYLRFMNSEIWNL